LAKLAPPEVVLEGLPKGWVAPSAQYSEAKAMTRGSIPYQRQAMRMEQQEPRLVTPEFTTPVKVDVQTFVNTGNKSNESLADILTFPDHVDLPFNNPTQPLQQDRIAANTAEYQAQTGRNYNPVQEPIPTSTPNANQRGSDGVNPWLLGGLGLAGSGLLAYPFLGLGDKEERRYA
jgi:hypothetical protein